jgi:hypothetical protein
VVFWVSLGCVVGGWVGLLRFSFGFALAPLYTSCVIRVLLSFLFL